MRSAATLAALVTLLAGCAGPTADAPAEAGGNQPITATEAAPTPDPRPTLPPDAQPPDAPPSPSDPPRAPPTGGVPGDFAFVLVRGNLTVAYPSDRAGVCGFLSPPEVDAQHRRIRFLNERVDLDATGAVAIALVWDGSLCGVMETRVATAAAADSLALPMPAGEPLALRWLADGSVEVAGRAVPAGRALVLERAGETDEGHPYRMTLHVENHGAWPKANVTFGDGPPP